MHILRGAIVLAFVAAVVGAGVVASQSAPVKDAGQQIGYVAPPQDQTLAVLGDAYSAGSDMGGVGANGWPARLAALNRLSLYNDSVPGTGYVAHTHGTRPFPQRVGALIAQKPSWVIVWGASDDIGKPLVAIRHAMTQTLDTLEQKLPAARIVVIGPAWINGDVPHRVKRTRDVEQSVAQAAKLQFIDPIAEGWFKGNDAAFIGDDRVNPTDQGHQHILFELQKDLAAFGLGRDAAQASDAVPPYVPTVTATVTPPPSTVTVTTQAPVATVTVTESAAGIG